MEQAILDSVDILVSRKLKIDDSGSYDDAKSVTVTDGLITFASIDVDTDELHRGLGVVPEEHLKAEADRADKLQRRVDELEEAVRRVEDVKEWAKTASPRTGNVNDVVPFQLRIYQEVERRIDEALSPSPELPTEHGTGVLAYAKDDSSRSTEEYRLFSTGHWVNVDGTMLFPDTFHRLYRITEVLP